MLGTKPGPADNAAADQRHVGLSRMRTAQTTGEITRRVVSPTEFGYSSYA